MATEHREKVQIIQDGDYEQRRRVVERNPSGRNVFISRFNQFIWLVAAIITALLGFRFMLIMANANPSNPFANIVYNLTAWLVYPFQGLVVNPTTASGGSVFEVTTLLAMVVYLLAAALLTTLIRIIFAERTGIRKVSTVERDRT